MNRSSEPLILITDGVQGVIRAVLAEHFGTVCTLSAPLTAGIDQLDAEARGRAAVLVTLGGSETPRAVMTALPRLGMICCTGTGYDGVDLHAAMELGICVGHSPGVTADSVADLAVGLLIASVRRLAAAESQLRMHGPVKPWPPAPGLTNRKAGIYGLGAIGEAVARRLTAFEMRIGHCSRRGPRDPTYRHFKSVLALAHWADDLIVCVPSTAETLGSVDAAVLAALGARGHLVNVSRAGVVNATALCAALQNGSISGAALDVFEAKDLLRLRTLPNLILTPHIGGATGQAEAGMADRVLRNVTAFLSGVQLTTPVPGSALHSTRAVRV